MQRDVENLAEAHMRYRRSRSPTTKWSSRNPGNAAMEEERQRVVGRLLENAGFQPLEGRRVLDVGCGGGQRLARFQEWGAAPEDLFGIDVIHDHIRVAQCKFPRVNFAAGNAEALPFATAFFDIVSAFVLFSSISSETMVRNVAAEMRRVLRPGGAIIYYDLRVGSPFNRHVQAITRTELQSLFPGFGMALQTLTVVPPIVRRLGPLTTRVYPALAAIPFLRTHYACLLSKN